MKRDGDFSSLLLVLAKDLLFLFLRDPEENMSDGKKEIVSIITFKNGHSRMTLELKPRMGKFCLLYANIAPKWNAMIACERALP